MPAKKKTAKTAPKRKPTVTKKARLTLKAVAAELNAIRKFVGDGSEAITANFTNVCPIGGAESPTGVKTFPMTFNGLADFAAELFKRTNESIGINHRAMHDRITKVDHRLAALESGATKPDVVWFGGGTMRYDPNVPHVIETRPKTTVAEFDAMQAEAGFPSELPDAPYGEAERRADAIAAGWKLINDCTFTFSPDGVEWTGDAAILADAKFGRITANGWKRLGEVDRNTFRAHLAKYAVKPVVAETFNDDGVDVTIERYASGTERVVSAKIPPATPDERRAEMERRGLKWWKSYEGVVMSRNGEFREYPAASVDGSVWRDSHADNNHDGIKTTTMPEFCAALDAVGLVAIDNTPKVDPLDVPLTKEAFDAEMASRGLDGSGGVWKIAKGVDVNKTVLSGFWADGNNPQRAAVWFGGSCWNLATLRELRAVLDANLPALVGEGPWDVETLNKAGIECVEMWLMGEPGAEFRHGRANGDSFNVVLTETTRSFLLWLSQCPTVNPEWAAKVRKALGVA